LETTMPRYYFDSTDGDHHVPDDVGLEFPDLDAAAHEAVQALPDIARDALPDGDRRDFVTNVRDEIGKVLFRATLSLTVEWLRPVP
jgi:hypothetical protein